MLKVSKVEGHYWVELFQVDRLNTLFSDLVKQQLNELVEEPGNSVIFDLHGIKFIDTAGFEVLKDISKRAENNGCAFLICNVTSEVKELINLLKLESTFAFCKRDKVEEKILLVLD